MRGWSDLTRARRRASLGKSNMRSIVAGPVAGWGKHPTTGRVAGVKSEGPSHEPVRTPVRSPADADPGPLAGRRARRVRTPTHQHRPALPGHRRAGPVDRGVAVAVPVPDARRRRPAALLAGAGPLGGRAGLAGHRDRAADAGRPPRVGPGPGDGLTTPEEARR